ncbi:hypothetical protein [Larkinella harenae]
MTRTVPGHADPSRPVRGTASRNRRERFFDFLRQKPSSTTRATAPDSATELLIFPKSPLFPVFDTDHSGKIHIFVPIGSWL